MAVLPPNRRPVVLPITKRPEYFTGTNPSCKINRDAKGTHFEVRTDGGFTGATLTHLDQTSPQCSPQKLS